MIKMKTKPPYEKAILSAKKEFIAITGKAIWERESKFAMMRFNMSTNALELRHCEPESIKQAVLNIAHTGVTLNPIFQEAYFIARDNRLFLDFTYKGLIRIATSEGTITSLSAGVVYTWDKLTFSQGTKSFLNHIPNMDPPKDPDEIARNPKLIWEYLKCAYAIATFPNGQESFVVLPKWKLLKTWQGIEKSAINEAFPEEWIRKTVVRYFSKTLPHAQRLVTATSILNEHEGIKKEKKKSRLMGRMDK